MNGFHLIEDELSKRRIQIDSVRGLLASLTNPLMFVNKDSAQ